MITGLIRYFLSFTCSFLILCVPIKKESLFTHLNRMASPYTKSLFKFFDQYVEKSVTRGKNLGRQFFSNSIPKSIPTQTMEGNFYSENSYSLHPELLTKQRP